MSRQWLVPAITVCAAAWGCSSEAPTPRGGPSASFETEDTIPSALIPIPVELVQGRTGPGENPFYVALRTPEGAAYLSRQIGRESFQIGLRTSSPDLTQYPCASCHEGREIISGARDETAVHQNIRAVHPAETGARCATCHSDENVASLRLERGDTASMDHAYRLCVQCHFAQGDAWANGAHGKRLVGWRGRRVVMGCTDCHSPHEPATERRIPYSGPALPGPLRGGNE